MITNYDAVQAKPPTDVGVLRGIEGQPGNGNFGKLYRNRCRPDRRLNVPN